MPYLANYTVLPIFNEDCIGYIYPGSTEPEDGIQTFSLQTNDNATITTFNDVVAGIYLFTTSGLLHSQSTDSNQWWNMFLTNDLPTPTYFGSCWVVGNAASIQVPGTSNPVDGVLAPGNFSCVVKIESTSNLYLQVVTSENQTYPIYASHGISLVRLA